MKGLKRIPELHDLSKAYDLLLKEQSLDSRKLVLFAHWTRFDPRLGEILSKYIAIKWFNLSGPLLNLWARKSVWPSTMGVLLDFAEALLTDSYIQKKWPKLLRQQTLNQTIRVYRAWKSIALRNVRPAKTQLYYIGLYKIGGMMINNQIQKQQRQFLNWGYLAADSWIHGKIKAPIEKTSRSEALKKLSQFGSFTVNDYLNIIDHEISRRQAIRDLAKNPLLASKGYTRNKVYWIRKG